MQGLCKVQLLQGSDNLHIIIEMQGNQSNVLVEIVKAHTNIQRMEKNGKTIYRNANAAEPGQPCLYSRLSMEGIFDFMKEVALDDVRGLLDLQIDDKLKIAPEGLEHNWGARRRTLRGSLGLLSLSCEKHCRQQAATPV
jgi:L-cysteine desulfidase